MAYLAYNSPAETETLNKLHCVTLSTLANDRSIHLAVESDNPVSTTVDEYNVGVFAAEIVTCCTTVPAAVPVNAAPLLGAPPVPVRICIWHCFVPVFVCTVLYTETSTLPLLVGVIVPARPIITAVDEVVPVGSAGVLIVAAPGAKLLIDAAKSAAEQRLFNVPDTTSQYQLSVPPYGVVCGV